MSISSVKYLVTSVIAANRVVIFSKSYCPFCNLAKTVLKTAGASKPFIIELDERNDSLDLQVIVAVRPGLQLSYTHRRKVEYN